MKTLSDLATALRSATASKGLNALRLHKTTGLSYLTVRDCLSGAKDARMTTVLALANQLGLELVLVPREVAASLEIKPHQAAVQTLVDHATQPTQPTKAA